MTVTRSSSGGANRPAPADPTVLPLDGQGATDHVDDPGRATDRPTAHPGLDRRVGVVLLVCGLVGVGAAFVLAVEKFRVLTNPFYVPSCSVNERLSCLSVMTSEQAEVFGFPNPLLGLVGFGALCVAGAAVLASSRPLAGWFWAGLQTGAAAGVVFVHWLAFQSSLVIGALCPYCMAVWVVTITAFVFITARNLARRRVPRQPQPLVSNPAVIALLWVLVVLTAAIAATTAGA